MSVGRKSRFRKHHPLRFLPNAVRETSSVPVRRVRKNVLVDERHALLPSPASKSHFRQGHHPCSRGRQHLRHCSYRRYCLEHRRPLARESRRRLPPFQPRPAHRIFHRGTPGRRDSHLRRGQETDDMDFRCDRSLVSRLRSGAPTEGADKEASHLFIKGPLPPSKLGHRIERGTLDLQSDMERLPERSASRSLPMTTMTTTCSSAGSTLATPHFGPEDVWGPPHDTASRKQSCYAST